MAIFETKLEKRGGTKPVWILTVSGRLDVQGVPVLKKDLDRVRSESRPLVVLDLGGLIFIGSAGIGLFLSFVEEIRGAGGDARFVEVPNTVRAVLGLLNVSEFIPQCSTREQAIAELVRGVEPAR
jgi:anti-sigma B factor antagonist